MVVLAVEPAWEVSAEMMMMAMMTRWKVSCIMNPMPWMMKKVMTKDLPFVAKHLQEMTPWMIQNMCRDFQARTLLSKGLPPVA